MTLIGDRLTPCDAHLVDGAVRLARVPERPRDANGRVWFQMEKNTRIGLQKAANGTPSIDHFAIKVAPFHRYRTLDVVRESALPVERVLLDHLNETTVEEAKDAGCWMGFSVYPDTKMDEYRMVDVLRTYGPEKVLVNSAADWGRSDPLKTRRVADALLAAGFGEDTVDLVLWRNPVAFYSLSGRLDLEAADPADPAATHEGNSILRGGE